MSFESMPSQGANKMGEGKNEEIGPEESDRRVKEYWEKFSTDDLKFALEQGDDHISGEEVVIKDFGGMTPTMGELGNIHPTKGTEELIKEILEEREKSSK